MALWEVKEPVVHYGMLGSTVGAGRHCASLGDLHVAGCPEGERPCPAVGHSPEVENH